VRSYVYAERIGLDHLRPMERPDPVPGPHDVVLRMRATTVHIATAGSRAAFETMVRAMELHAIRPAISRDFPVEQIAAAFECLQQGGHFGKVVVRF
jgi:NADPH:quinone reductase-like Zn-dependent oxidoreductase